MPRISRAQIAKPDIIETFNKMPNVLTATMITKVFRENKDTWRLAKNMMVKDFIKFLIHSTELKKVNFPFPRRNITGYTWGEVPLLEVLTKLNEKLFYSHYTAMRIHGLTEQIPKTIYLNSEKSEGYVPDRNRVEDQFYEQQAIDSAFRKKPRQTKNEIEIPDKKCRIVMLQSGFHRNIGVINMIFYDGSDNGIPIRCTNLERTMIDIVVRPFYSGGIFEVLKAFENAKDKISVNKMSAILKQMNFGYPYHQSIGFLLERAGYKESLVNIFRQQQMVRDFYITYEINEPIYCREWRLFIPKGL
jgi:hypothetical protein